MFNKKTPFLAQQESAVFFKKQVLTISEYPVDLQANHLQDKCM